MTMTWTAENERALVFLVDEGVPKTDAHALMPGLVAFAEETSQSIADVASEAAVIYDGLLGDPDRVAGTMQTLRAPKATTRPVLFRIVEAVDQQMRAEHARAWQTYQMWANDTFGDFIEDAEQTLAVHEYCAALEAHAVGDKPLTFERVLLAESRLAAPPMPTR